MEGLLPQAEKECSPFLCFRDERFSPGVCGLLAGRLCEAFGKPTLVAGCNGAIPQAARQVPPADHRRQIRGNDLLVRQPHRGGLARTERRREREAP